MSLRILDWYMARSLFMNSAIALFLLLSIFFVFGFLDQIGDIGKGAYRIVDALWYVALTLPRSLCELMPTVAVVGTMSTLGMMARNGELVFLRSCGLSASDLASSLLKGGIALVLLYMAVDEWVASAAELRGERLRTEKILGTNLFANQGEFWVREGATFINIRALESPEFARSLLVYEFNDQDRLVRALHAKSAEYLEGHWWLRGVHYSQLALQDVDQDRRQEVNAGYMEKEVRDFAIDPQAMAQIVRTPRQLSIPELVWHLDYLRNSGQENRLYLNALYAKFFTPLGILFMLPLALALIGPATRGVSLAQRVFAGIFIGVAWHVFCELARNMSVIYAFPPLLGVGGPVFLLMGLMHWRLRSMG
ncbi:MAG: LPS export ABC transporter permease LptG [Candidatus Eutrophobiaceae bacterium]